LSVANQYRTAAIPFELIPLYEKATSPKRLPNEWFIDSLPEAAMLRPFIAVHGHPKEKCHEFFVTGVEKNAR